MKKISFFHFLKLFIILLLSYNIVVVSILYIPINNIKNTLWKWTPYNYKKGLYYPNNFNQLSLLNKDNRIFLLDFLNKNMHKDYLDINFWNFKQIIESIDRDNVKDLEKSFYKAFILSKITPNLIKNYENILLKITLNSQMSTKIKY